MKVASGKRTALLWGIRSSSTKEDHRHSTQSNWPSEEKQTKRSVYHIPLVVDDLVMTRILRDTPRFFTDCLPGRHNAISIILSYWHLSFAKTAVHSRCSDSITRTNRMLSLKHWSKFSTGRQEEFIWHVSASGKWRSLLHTNAEDVNNMFLIRFGKRFDTDNNECRLVLQETPPPSPQAKARPSMPEQHTPRWGAARPKKVRLRTIEAHVQAALPIGCVAAQLFAWRAPAARRIQQPTHGWNVRCDPIPKKHQSRRIQPTQTPEKPATTVHLAWRGGQNEHSAVVEA